MVSDMDMEMDMSGEDESKGGMWALEQKIDQPMDEEAGRLKNMYREKKFSALLLLQLSFQSLGVVYGDLGTSPLYVFYNTFPDKITDTEDIVGALSLIIYSLTLVPLIKYVFIVCRANDNGQGGTFALYSLLCRHAKVNTIPNQHKTDEELTTYSRSTIHEKSFAAKTRRWLEGDAFKKNVLLLLVLVGTCMAVGDGILTPAISVLSASGGIKIDHPGMSTDVVVVVAVVILVGLFSLQHYGVDKVGWLFAPIVLLWFLLIGGIGIFNIWKHDSGVLRAFSPVYIFRYFKRRGKKGWTSLGGIMLSITGTEALFADLAHFPVSAIQLAFTVVVFPCLLLAYSGQAAYLMNNKDHASDAFYRSIPDGIYWPMFIIATLAAIVASQATISATFSIIKQANALGCFPRVKVIHTSSKFLGQIYIPDINWILMILCIVVTAGFKNQSQIGNAYGEDSSRYSHASKNFHMFRCVARYGYKDLHKKDEDFEKKLFDNLFMFVRLESMMEGGSDSDDYSLYGQQTQGSKDLLLSDTNNNTFSSVVDLTISSCDSIVPAKSPLHVRTSGTSSGQVSSQREVDEMEFLTTCRDAGVVHIMGNTVVRARRDSSLYKKLSIDYVYAFLRKICREHSVIFNVPHESLLNVGQVFYV
ncbi:putative potassium transporter [Helianthus annuus]|nr:putative potassium transporter [Helianthus annuus]KAJ0485486.1 putative potassium transporter [Helianthus annuus]